MSTVDPRGRNALCSSNTDTQSLITLVVLFCHGRGMLMADPSSKEYYR